MLLYFGIPFFRSSEDIPLASKAAESDKSDFFFFEVQCCTDYTFRSVELFETSHTDLKYNAFYTCIFLCFNFTSLVEWVFTV